MKTMRFGVFCALVGWIAADAQAQMGTYGSPDPISLGQYGPQSPYVPMLANRTTYVNTADGSVSGPAPTTTTSESSAVSRLLSEPSASMTPAAAAAAPGQCNVMPEGGSIQQPGNCEICNNCCGGCCCPWYFSADALYMTRSKPNIVYTSAQAGALVNQGYYNDSNWTWGAEATLGYRFGCCCDWAVQGTYWGLCEGSSDGGPGITGPYVTPLIFGLTDILGTTGGGGTGGAQTANNYTDNSPEHHTWRNYQAQDVEFNLVRTVCGGQCSPFGVDFLAGIRWFRFQDGMIWGAERANDGSAYANDWLYLNDHITNDLVGGQLGFNASYRFADCWKVFLTPEFGVYNNHMTLDYNVYAVSSTTSQQFQASSQTYANPNYPVHTTSDGFSFLTQVDLGLDWQVTRCLSTQIGYRVVAVTGMGLSDSQIPFYGNDTQAIANIQHEDSLLLHGLFGGLTFTW